ncbi:MAG: ATP-binding cassette domain-containing protein, partial [Actinomycetota bacterium]
MPTPTVHAEPWATAAEPPSRPRSYPHRDEAPVGEVVLEGDPSLDVTGVSVRAPGGQILVDRVSFSLRRGMLLAIVGPTGAGKSTLLETLSGAAAPTSGTVLVEGADLHEAPERLRGCIGYVPQENVLHPQLTVRQTLDYAAELRFPAAIGREERRRRVEEVLAELGLNDRADRPVHGLSGGERKRTNVAVELLTRPQILLLDEPTSGLDPGYEKAFMSLLRGLADGGRTVVVVTHHVQSLGMCDRVLYLAPAGQTAFFGPPSEAPAYFGRGDAADVLAELASPGKGAWGPRFEGHPMYRRHVGGPSGAVGRPWVPSRRLAVASGIRQLWTLVRRYLSLIASDRRYLAMLVVQAPVLGLLILAAAPPNGFASTPGAPDPTSVALFLVLSATWLGTSNAVREIVKERAITRRERAAGLSMRAYVASKVIVLSAITVAQAAVLVTIATLRQGGPHSSLLGLPRVELVLDVALAGLAAMAIGLLISAFARTPDKALTVLPLALVAQLVLSGAFSISTTPGLREASYLASARWGLSAAASSMDMTSIIESHRVPPSSAGPEAPAGAAAAPPAAMPPRRLWRHDHGTWAIDALALLVLAGLWIGGAALRVEREGRVELRRSSGRRMGMPAITSQWRPALLSALRPRIAAAAVGILTASGAAAFGLTLWSRPAARTPQAAPPAASRPA